MKQSMTESCKKKVQIPDMASFRHLYPFDSRYQEVNGLCLHYIDEGVGEPILMLHGNPTWSFYYRNMIKALSNTNRCIAPDHIGCGLSEKPTDQEYDFTLKRRVADLDRLLGRLNLQEKITLVLHDWGGMIGLAWAVDHPGQVGRIILTNTAGFFPPGVKGLPLRLRMVRDLSPLAAPAVLWGNLFARSALYMAPAKLLPKAVKKGLIAPYDTPAHRLATLRFVQDIPVHPGNPSYAIVKRTQQRLERLASIPMLICWGEKDFVFDIDYFNEWRRRFPHAQARSYPDAGHYLFEDAGDQILPLIRDFLKNHPI